MLPAEIGVPRVFPQIGALPYCDVFALITSLSSEAVAAVLPYPVDSNRPGFLELLNFDSPSNIWLTEVGEGVTREVDSACHQGHAYIPSDLLCLSPSKKDEFEKFVANLWHWRCAQRRGKGLFVPEPVPDASRALAALARLQCGERIFGDPVWRVERYASVLRLQGYTLELTTQTARMLELALRSSGLSFDAAREEFAWNEFPPSAIRAQVEKMKKAIHRVRKDCPYDIDVSARGKVIRALPRPKQ